MLASNTAQQTLHDAAHTSPYWKSSTSPLSSPCAYSGTRLGRRPLSALHAINRDEMLSKAKQFYEEAWAGKLGLMDELIAEEHAQRDMVWQEEPRLGRDKLRKGIEYIRSIYPDIEFTVQEGSACTDSQKVFVHWRMTGTFEGESAQTSGISLMSFDGTGLISETQVYRQALPAEVVMAQRSKRVEPVEQGILLEAGSSSSE
ncbi:g12132 [Coccomyxa viridis]|uniref:G12132 protein n=1 Tax=Coccomyxa viridis TaxID=1274662 RepID=A0ABP1GDQ9_9CHLO